VIVLYRQQFLRSGFYPLLFFYRPATGTVPVPATVVLNLQVPARRIIAPAEVIAKFNCTADPDPVQYLLYMSVPMSMIRQILPKQKLLKGCPGNPGWQHYLKDVY
jgi:hypothetical protein